MTRVQTPLAPTQRTQKPTTVRTVSRFATACFFAGALLGASPKAHSEETVPIFLHAELEGGSLLLSMETLEAKAPLLSWPQTRWTFVRGSGTQLNLDQMPVDAEGHRAKTPWPHLESAMVGVDLQVDVRTISGRVLQQWTLKRDPSLETDRLYAVKTVTSAKKLLDGSPRRHDIATSKSGQRVEIRPLVDPIALNAGSDLPIRAYVEGIALQGAQIVAEHPKSDTRLRFHTDRVGIGHARFEHEGQWFLHFRHLHKNPDDKNREGWILYTATLSFELGGGGR